MSKIITQQRLKEVLDYDPDSGVFTWKIAHARARDRAGGTHTNEEGYRRIKIDGQLHREHRLAWLYIHGEMPEGLIDHVNGIRSDNRACNLRLANKSLNAGNSRRRKNNSTGTKGVGRLPYGKWCAKLAGKHLGSFDTKEEAAAAYATAARSYFGEFARLA